MLCHDIDVLQMSTIVLNANCIDGRTIPNQCKTESNVTKSTQFSQSEMCNSSSGSKFHIIWLTALHLINMVHKSLLLSAEIKYYWHRLSDGSLHTESELQI